MTGPAERLRTIAFANALSSRRASGLDPARMAGRRAETRRSWASAAEAAPACCKQWLAARRGRRSPTRWNWGGGRVMRVGGPPSRGDGSREAGTGRAHLLCRALRIGHVTERDSGPRDRNSGAEDALGGKGGSGCERDVRLGAATAAHEHRSRPPARATRARRHAPPRGSQTPHGRGHSNRRRRWSRCWRAPTGRQGPGVRSLRLQPVAHGRVSLRARDAASTERRP